MTTNQAKQTPDLLVPSGTQIVTLVEKKALHAAKIQPLGAVGVVISPPKDATHSYLIEFLDGAKASLKRHEFAVRKQFQQEKIGGENFLEDTDLRRFVIYRCVVGSRAYGLDDETSDTDYRGIYLPPAVAQWAIFGVPEQIENKETEECYWELRKFLILALKANPNILECLNTPLIEYADDLARELLGMREIFFSKLVYQTYNGYVMSQFKKLEQDRRVRGEIRWKHAMHLIRLLLQGVEILRAGELNLKVAERRENLLAVKRGEIDWETVNVWRINLHEEFDRAFAETKLPDRPDYRRANEFLLKARRSMVKNA